jgi:hypothetical protein
LIDEAEKILVRLIRLTDAMASQESPEDLSVMYLKRIME